MSHWDLATFIQGRLGGWIGLFAGMELVGDDGWEPIELGTVEACACVLLNFF